MVEVDCLRAVRPGLAVGRMIIEADPLEALRDLMPPPPAHALPADCPPFIGGAVGALGYELAEQIEPLSLGAVDDLGIPDLQFLFVDRLLVHDTLTGRTRVVGLGFAETNASARKRAEGAADELGRRLRAPAPARPRLRPVVSEPPGPPFAFFDAGTYAKAVDAAKEEIAVGNAYQVCLTQRMEWNFAEDPWSLYRRLRSENAAPFASYIELRDVSIVGSSPERFLRLRPDRRVESRPMKGTMPRSGDPSEDQANRRRLAWSAKDRAENLMIVDLVRNDLGRVCETGSVEVPELMTIEDYAAVFQMVSTVRGRLRADRDIVDLLRATFPPGSMTGAPKIAAMRIIDRLEPVRRGVYSGALGYFDVRGGLDLCVVIRTVLVRDGRAHVQAGGGIVADSDSSAEWLESLDKARPLIAALDRAGV
jgi:para-aminobenzoate synthetase component 1